MMLLLIFNFAFTFPLSIFASIMQAYERFVWLRVVNILRVILNPCMVLPLLLCGYGSVMMVVVTTVLNLSCLLTNVWYCYRHLQVKFCWGHYERPFLREVAVYSFFIFLNAIMDKIYYSSGQFILGIVSGTVEVAIYAVAMQFIAIYMQFSGAISGVLLPKVTMMVSRGVDAQTLSDLFIRIGRLQYFVVVYIMTMFALVGREFLFLWAGEGYLPAYLIVLLFMMADFTALVQNTGIAILQAMNLNRYRMTVYTVAAGICFVASFPMAYQFGGMGCAIAATVVIVISTGFLMNRYYQRVIHLDMPRFWCNMLQMSTGSALFLLSGIALQYCYALPYGWGDFILRALAYSALYILLLYRLSMNDDERGLFQRILKRVPGLSALCR